LFKLNDDDDDDDPWPYCLGSDNRTH